MKKKTSLKLPPNTQKRALVVKGKGRCLFCQKYKVGGSGSMAIISGGATLVTNSGSSTTCPDAHLEEMLTLIWHGGPPDGDGVDKDIDVHVDLATGSQGGEFEFYFCSTQCMRAFLNGCVDALEEKVRAASRKRRTPSR